MKKPDFITEEDINRWNEILDQDTSISVEHKNNLIIREVCYAGMWLFEQLQERQCPDSLSVRIQYSAAKLCPGKDPWSIHQMMLDQYDKNQLTIENEPNSNN